MFWKDDRRNPLKFMTGAAGALLLAASLVSQASAMGGRAEESQDSSVEWREQDGISAEFRSEAVGPLFERAKKEYEAREYQKALLDFQEVLRIDPAHPWARLYAERSEEKLQQKREQQEAAVGRELEIERKRQEELKRRAEDDYRKRLKDEKSRLTQKAAEKEKEAPAEAAAAPQRTAAKTTALSGGDPEELYKEGVELYRNKDYAQAVQKFEQSLSADPDHKKAAYYLKAAQERLGDAPAQAPASAKAQSASAASSMDVDELYKQAVEDYRNKDYAKALQGFEQILKQDPSHRKAEYYQKASKERLGESGAAAMETAKKEEPAPASGGGAEELYKQAVEDYRSKDYVKALQGFNQVLTLDPDHKKAAYYKQSAQEKIGEQPMAQTQTAQASKPSEKKPVEPTPEAGNMAIQDRWEKLAKRQTDLDAGMQRIEDRLNALQKTSSTQSKGKSEIHAQLQEMEKERDALRKQREDLAKEIAALRVEREAAAERMKADYREVLSSSDPGRIYLEGKERYKKGEYETAKSFFLKVVELDPTHRAAQKYLDGIDEDIARELKKIEKEQEKARQAAEKELVKKRKQQEREYWEAGSDFYRRGAYEEAKEQFERLLEINPDHAKAKDHLNRISVTLERAEREMKQAQVSEIELWERKRADRREGWQQETEVDMRIKEKEIAEREARIREEKLKELWVKARAGEDGGDYQQAIDSANKILILDPENRDAKKYIQRLEIKEKNEAKRRMEEQRRQELSLRSEKTQELLAQGRHQYDLGHWAEAVRLFGDALNLDPGNRQAGSWLDRSRTRMGASTMIDLETPLNADPRFLEGEGLYRQGYYRQAFEKFSDVVADTPLDDGALRAWQLSLQQLQGMQVPGASTMTQQEEQYHLEEGRIHLRSGRYRSALMELDKILTLDPHHSDALLMRADALEKYQKSRSQAKMQAQRRAMELAGERTLSLQQQGETPQELPESADSAIAPEPQAAAQQRAPGSEAKVDAYLKAGRELLSQRRYEDAVTKLETAVAVAPANTEARDLLQDARKGVLRSQQDELFDQRMLDEEKMLLEIEQKQILPEGYGPSGLRQSSSGKLMDALSLSLAKAPALRERLSQPVSLDFQQVKLEYILKYLIETTGVNILPSSQVRDEERQMTIRLKDVPLQDALEYMFRKEGLVWRVEDDAIWVTTANELAQEPVETRIYFLNQGKGLFADLSGAAEAAGGVSIRDVLEQVVPPNPQGKLVFDERSSALIVTDSPTNLSLIEEVLYNIDVSPVQVLIEARFVEITVSDLKQLGIEAELNSPAVVQKEEGANKIQVDTGSGFDFGTSGMDFASIFTGRGTEGFNLSYRGILTSPQFQIVLHALEENSKTKTLSAPRITTLNNQTATIEVVDEYVYPTRYEVSVVREDLNADGDAEDVVNGVSETRFVNLPQDFITRDLGILLHVTPSVGKERDRIALSLVPEVSELKSVDSFSGDVAVPRFSSRNLSTSVIIKDGETVVLGGLITETNSKLKTKVPVLGDLPVIGGLFSRSSDDVDRRNLVIFVTSNILAPDGSLVAKQEL